MASSHHDWLLSQLPEWEREGLLTPEAAAVLRKRSLAATEGKGQLGLLIFGGIGAVLVAGGLIALLAHNWDDFPRWLRVAMGFAPMVAGQALAAWAIQKGEALAAWIREATGVFLAISVGACLAIVSQIYSMGGEWETLLLAWSLLALPVAWLLPSDTVAMLYVIGISIWAESKCGWGKGQDGDWKWYPVLIALLVGWWPGLHGKPLRTPPLAFRWVAAVCFMLVANSMSYSLGTGGLFRDCGGFMMLGPLYVLLPEPAQELSQRPFKFIGFLVLTLWALFFSTGSSYLNQGTPQHLPWIWWLSIIAACVAVPFAVRRKQWAHLVLASVILLPFIQSGLSFGGLRFIATLQLVATGILMILPAFKGEGGTPRAGALLISVVIAMQFTNSELSLSLKGCGFIIVGVGFLVFNVLLARRSREVSPP